MSTSQNILERPQWDGGDIPLNIQPQASILNVFSRLNYKPWYALAEFVDNSTQSYFSHKDILQSSENFDKLVVSIEYDDNARKLIVSDNAFGMELERFTDAILLDSKNSEQVGRNEFGMGLKTAASWFGEIWKVTSTQYGSTTEYFATIDIPHLKADRINTIAIHTRKVDAETHGTVIEIDKVSKRLVGRTIAKVRSLLSSMYRRDIGEENIEIRYNGEPIETPVFEVLENFRGKRWEKPLDFEVNFDSKTYRVTGFVAIMSPGGFPKAGFALFRQNRVVIGGEDQNYKPNEIFGQAQSQVSLKLFGELDMNDFPVNQAKDGFVWDDGLEEAFIDKLKENIVDYIEIARLSIKERQQESQYSAGAAQAVHDEVGRDIERVNEAIRTGLTLSSESVNEECSVDIREYVDSVLLPQDSEIREVSLPRTYDVQINSITRRKVTVTWVVGTSEFWIDIVPTDNGLNVSLNIDHPFFRPYSNDDDFKRVLEKFACAFVFAEERAKAVATDDGKAHVTTIRHAMNDYLSKLGAI